MTTQRPAILAAADAATQPSAEEVALAQRTAALRQELASIVQRLQDLRDARTNAWRDKLNELKKGDPA